MLIFLEASQGDPYGNGSQLYDVLSGIYDPQIVLQIFHFFYVREMRDRRYHQNCSIFFILRTPILGRFWRAPGDPQKSPKRGFRRMAVFDLPLFLRKPVPFLGPKISDFWVRFWGHFGEVHCGSRSRVDFGVPGTRISVRNSGPGDPKSSLDGTIFGFPGPEIPYGISGLGTRKSPPAIFGFAAPLFSAYTDFRRFSSLTDLLFVDIHTICRFLSSRARIGLYSAPIPRGAVPAR